jgi:hypothetical protein
MAVPHQNVLHGEFVPSARENPHRPPMTNALSAKNPGGHCGAPLALLFDA